LSEELARKLKNIQGQIFSERDIWFAQAMDTAIISKDDTEIFKLIAEIKEYVETLSTNNKRDLSYINNLYVIANGYQSLSSHEIDQEKLIFNTLHYFREAIEVFEASGLINNCDELYYGVVSPVVCGIYTNYANKLKSLGRVVLAAHYYKKSITLNKNHHMTLGLYGENLSHYAYFLSDPGHRNHMNHNAYRLLKIASTTSDPNVYPEAKAHFQNITEHFEKLYHLSYLQRPLSPDMDKSKKCRKKIRINPSLARQQLQESMYVKWVLKTNLYLNPLNDLSKVGDKFAQDILHLPNMTFSAVDSDSDELLYPKYHTMFNQIKQDFITSRYYYYQGIKESRAVHFADKNTYLQGGYGRDLQYSIRLENVKSSLKLAYSTLDKVAFFINEYFDLGIKKKDVTFYSIWLTEKKGKSGYQYSRNLLDIENPFLTALYWIRKDFSEKSEYSSQPFSRVLSNIRQALEHKYIKIYHEHSYGYDEEYNPQSDIFLSINEADLKKYTLEMLRLSREAIIYLSLAVGIEESRDPQGTALPIKTLVYPDHYKR